MKNLNATRPAARRSTLSISSTVTTILLAAAGSARAADQPTGTAAAPADQPLQEVVVTGIRKGIEDAVAAKKASADMIEEVSSEDIGKLPDASIAESIARLPGLAAQRTNGRAQIFAIRGLGPDFTVTTLNGREQASVNDNRTVEFDQYPAELVSAVKVFKTPDAGMAYQGIAGTADIETVRPIAYGRRAVAFGYQRDQDSQQVNVPGYERGGNRVNLMYIDQFRDNTLGVAFGAAYNKTPYQAQTEEPWGYATTNNGAQGLPVGDEVLGGDKDGIKSAYYERTGFMGVAEFKPVDSVHMVFDGYHSDFKELQAIRRMEYGTIWGGPGTTLSQIGSVDGNRVTSGTFTNIPYLVAENYNNDRRAHLNSLGYNLEFDPSDNWALDGDLSYSWVRRTDLRLESTAGLGRNDSTQPAFLPPPETVNFTTNSTGVTNLVTQHSYSDYNTTFLTDPGNWGGGPTRSGYLGHPTVYDDIKAVKLAAIRKLSASGLHDVTVGVNYAQRTKWKYQWQSILYLPGGVSHAVVPAAYRQGIINTSFFGNPNGMINYDAYGLYNSGFWTTIDSRVDPNANPSDTTADYTNSWSVTEKLTTAYAKLDIDTHVSSFPLTGNLGVQTLTADQKANLFFSPGAASQGSYQDSGRRYTDVLPSLNLALGLPDDSKLRFAAAKTEARPRMDDLAGGGGFVTISDNVSPLTGPNGQPVYWEQNSGGNPKLRPWMANAFDLALEKYFSNRGYVSGALYYKSLTSYIYPRLILVDFTGFPLPPNVSGGPTYTKADANRIGFGKIASNGSGGTIRGAELSVSLPAEVLTPVLQGFGLLASASWNRSEIHPDGLSVPVPGLSPKVINSTLYYERGGFSARVSDRFRGAFVGEVPAYDATLTVNNVKSENLVDAQIGYTFTEGRFNGLSMNLSGSNLTNERFALYGVGAPPFDIIKYERYGALYSGAVRYKF